MAKLTPNAKKEIFAHFKDFQTIHLATHDGKSPRVRPVTLAYLDGRFWVLTGSGDAKMRQLARDPSFEFCLMLEKKKERGTLRASGRARIVRDRKTKASVAGKVPWFSNYWKDPGHQGYGLIGLDVSAIEYMRPGEMESEKYVMGK